MKRKFKDISSKSGRNTSSKQQHGRNKKINKFNFINIFNKKSNKQQKFKNISSKSVNSKLSAVLLKTTSIITKIFICIILLFTIVASIAVTALTVYLMKASDNQFSLKLDKMNLINNSSTVVLGLDNEGKYTPLNEVATEAKCVWVDLKKIPVNLQNAIVAIEDRDFFKHQGVNWKRTATVAANFVFKFWNSNQGGSTLTQQLLKNLTNDRAAHGFSGVKRKIREMYRALSLERQNSKEQIMQAYLNIAHVGGKYGNFKGVGIAAKLYFNKDVSNLNLAECASIASLIRSPVFYDPIENAEHNKARRDKTLKNMLDLNMINKDEFDKAINFPIKTSKGKINDKNISNYQSYFVDSVLNQAVSDYMKLKKINDWNRANDIIKSGGLKIYSTIDVEMQNKLEKLFANPARLDCKTFAHKPQAACVVYDLNGNMKACVGGLGEKSDGDRSSTNYATGAILGPGSSIKPFVYCLAINKNILTYSTVMEDEPIKKVEDRDWPQNFDKKYHGNVTMESALEQSLNTIPIKITKKLGVESICEFLMKDLNFSSIYPPSKPYDRRTFESEALAIGSLTKGVRLNEITNAFQIFGNGGYFSNSTTYEKICNSAGEILFEPKKEPRRVIESSTSAIMNRLLRRVVTNGTGKMANLDSFGIELVGKTGTSDDEKSLMFIGVTPEYVIGVWVGGKGFIKPVALFKKVATEIFKGSEKKGKKTFDQIQNLVEQQKFCKKSGQLATSRCPSSEIGVGYYKKNKLPPFCKIHG